MQNLTEPLSITDMLMAGTNMEAVPYTFLLMDGTAAAVVVKAAVFLFSLPVLIRLQTNKSNGFSYYPKISAIWNKYL